MSRSENSDLYLSSFDSLISVRNRIAYFKLLNIQLQFLSHYLLLEINLQGNNKKPIIKQVIYLLSIYNILAILRLKYQNCYYLDLDLDSVRSVNNYQENRDLYFSMHHFSSSPIHTQKRSHHSPQKAGYNGGLIAKSPRKSQHSPIKANTLVSPAYTVHNQQKLKVFIKFKPPSNQHLPLNITYVNEKQIQIQRQSSNNKLLYNYDRVFHESVASQKVFVQGCQDIIQEMFTEGHNGLIFVYGHTGTGKTFTMGLLDSINQQSKGIVPQSLRYLFKAKQKFEGLNNKNQLQLSLSFNQIYMDQVYDMLDFQSDSKLQIRQNQITKEPYIENNISIIINSIQQAFQLLNIGLQKRRVGEQRINKRSSRGHGVITISISLPNTKVCKLCFVDLAGSQRVKQSQSIGKTLKQAVHINTSLSALEALLMNIDEQSVRMYRGNKLTRLLQPFMQSGKIRLFVTSNYENIQPIQFAKRCKGIKFMQKQIQQSHIQYRGKSTTPKNLEAQKAITKRVQQLQQQNKTLTQLLTSSVVLLNKISKLIGNMIEEQNTHSTFTLSEDYNLNNFSKDIESQINQKINLMEMNQEEILEKYTYLANQTSNSNRNLNKESKASIDDSVNTSAASNNKTDKLGSDMQSILNFLGTQPQKISIKLNEIGFGIFQSVKQLALLCQYRNGYKKELFLSSIKEKILQNKNRKMELGINCLLKTCRSSQINKITKQLKEFGIQINNSSSTSKSGVKVKLPQGQYQKFSNINRSQQHYESPLSTPYSKSIPIPIPKVAKNISEGNSKNTPEIYEKFINYHDDDELFNSYPQNNANKNNKEEERIKQSGNKSSKQSPAFNEKNLNDDKSRAKIKENLTKSAKRGGGLILIEDL